jgi:hypothetical protein
MEARSSNSESSYWHPVPTNGLIAMLAGVGALMLIIISDDDGFIQVLDSFNLMVHEAGHPIFGIFGEYIGFWGGTLMQLLVPFVAVIAFWRERAALSCALAGVWFFENFLNIARYMADARAQELPLIGGGEHDWAYILGKSNLLASDTSIARVVHTLGWAGMIGSCLFAIAVWYSQRNQPSGAGASSAEARPTV